LTQHDHEKSKIALALYGQPFVPKLSSCYCALHFPIVPCHGGITKKYGGHSKKIFQTLRARICASLKCFRRHWSRLWLGSRLRLWLWSALGGNVQTEHAQFRNSTAHVANCTGWQIARNTV